jgi:predicted NBD/HSP70 family sugar kinase/DNA-binding MarR family transcriptional regulator
LSLEFKVDVMYIVATVYKMTVRSKNNHGADQSLARKHNRSRILDLLRLEGPLARSALAWKIGLTRSTISRIIAELSTDQLVREVELSQGSKGRPGMLLELDPNGGSAIGVEIGVNFISILLTDFTANFLWTEKMDIPDDMGPEFYLPQAEYLIQKAVDQAFDRGLRLMGIGVAVWGLVDQSAGVIRFAPNLKWRDVVLKERWEKRFQVPVYAENDANASALGEYYFGAGKNVENFLYMSMDIGIGGGIISNGRLFHGASGYAGEFGHITIDPGGSRCNCGKVGCLETEVGKKVVLEKYKERTGLRETVSLQEVIKRGRSGDKVSQEIFQETADALGRGLGILVNIFNPERVILGWSLGQAFDLMIPRLWESINKHSLADSYQGLEIVPFTSELDDCLLGCVALVLDEIIRERVCV